MYTFYEPVPAIEYIDGRQAHLFKCMARGCKVRVQRFLNKRDTSSTLSLQSHTESCWGIEAVKAAKEAASLKEARDKVVGGLLQTGSITVFFARKEGKVTYSHCPRTKIEAQMEITRWVCESRRSFSIVRDCGYLLLIKTGWPSYYVPSHLTVAQDVKTVFACLRTRTARMLQDYPGCFSFAADAWSSSNHYTYVVVTVHFQHQGEPVILLLDVVAVARLHSGA
ncbi:hypothetical protein C8Q80DRAFT_1066304, partial [Daedaleopsis nitida]